MYAQSNTVDRLYLIHAAGETLDAITGDLFGVEKAINPGTRRGFDRIVATIASQLRRAAQGAELDAVRAAVDELDVDWRRTTPERRRRIVESAMFAAKRETEKVAQRIEAPLGDAAEEIVDATRKDVRRRQRLAIAAKFNEVDRKVIEFTARSPTNFVRNEYGERVDAFGERARAIVAEGLESGMGRSEIARELERAAEEAIVRKSPFYWEVIAGAFAGQGRAFAQMSSYAEAGIKEYVIEAVLDEVTSDTCRFLHGKRFSVQEAMNTFDRLSALEDPEEIKNEMPWVRKAIDPETGVARLYVQRGGERQDLAEITRSGRGERDDRGEFRPLMSDGDLGRAGIGFPPYHGLCRTTTFAVV